jgi:hypothetical protein
MKIVYIHYHLKTGGVTTVLRQQVDAVRDTCEPLVLTGVPSESSFPCAMATIPGLGYDGTDQTESSPENVASSIIQAIHLKWKDGCDIVHVHNPTLAKNKNFLKTLRALQNKKITLFLQIHDFAEDGRPAHYFSHEDYISNCHYGVINSRDYNILLKAGLKKEGLHKLPNTIKLFPARSTYTKTKDYVLYPIRAIRRKNIGEAILLSLFFKNNETLVITLPPNSPKDIESYEGWKDFVKEKNLNVEVDAGLTEKFSELVLSSRFILTTSITEGFGFSFLEPWTARKSLWGRKLPDICDDFERNGIRLTHLYTKLAVPVEWIGEETLLITWEACLRNACAKFRMEIDEPAIRKAFGKITKNGVIDFGLLNETFQKIVISHVLAGQAQHNQLARLNPFLSDPGGVTKEEELIQNNMNAIRHNYNQTIYKRRLLDVYFRVLEYPVRQRIKKDVLSTHFINPETFSLLKWSDDVE